MTVQTNNSSPPQYNIQSNKQVTITTNNTTTTYYPDQGYDYLSSIDVTTAISTTTQITEIKDFILRVFDIPETNVETLDLTDFFDNQQTFTPQYSYSYKEIDLSNFTLNNRKSIIFAIINETKDNNNIYINFVYIPDYYYYNSSSISPSSTRVRLYSDIEDPIKYYVFQAQYNLYDYYGTSVRANDSNGNVTSTLGCLRKARYDANDSVRQWIVDFYYNKQIILPKSQFVLDYNV